MVVLMAILVATSAAFARHESEVPARLNELVKPAPLSANGERIGFRGKLRIYMVEPESRYLDWDGFHFGFGFLCWAGGPVGLSIDAGESFSHSVIWDASQAGFYGVQPDNIMVQAVCFDSASFTNFSDPPNGAPFDAYFAHASAQASPGLPGQNIRGGPDSTHTVFLEEITEAN